MNRGATNNRPTSGIGIASSPPTITTSSGSRSNNASPELNQDSMKRKSAGVGVNGLTKKDVDSVLHLNQQDAARELGVSLSTLKRKFYALYGEERWPYHFRREVLQKKFHERSKKQQQQETTNVSPTASLSSSSSSSPSTSTSSSPRISPSPDRIEKRRDIREYHSHAKIAIHNLLHRTNVDEKSLDVPTLQVLHTVFGVRLRW